MLNHKEQIGRLDRRITFQSKVVGENESNEDEETGWEDITNPDVWASRDDKSGNEMYTADKLTGFNDAVFIIRYRSDINIMMRIVCEGFTYDIRSLQEVGRRRYLAIIAERGKEYVEIGGDDSWVLSSGTWDDEEHWNDEGIWRDNP